MTTCLSTERMKIRFRSTLLSHTGKFIWINLVLIGYERCILKRLASLWNTWLFKGYYCSSLADDWLLFFLLQIILSWRQKDYSFKSSVVCKFSSIKQSLIFSWPWYIWLYERFSKFCCIVIHHCAMLQNSRCMICSVFKVSLQCTAVYSKQQLKKKSYCRK